MREREFVILVKTTFDWLIIPLKLLIIATVAYSIPASLHLCLPSSLPLSIPASLHPCLSPSLPPSIPAVPPSLPLSLHLCLSSSLSASLHPCPPSLSPSHRWHQVSLKIIKHCQEEGSSSELVTGFLVGLVVGRTLEVTNCFPLPKDLDDTEEESEYIAMVSHTHTQNKH